MRRGRGRSGELAAMRREALMQRINLDEKFGLFTDHWRPKIIAAANGQEVKIVKVQGEFPWHHHDTEDEFFMVWKGRFRVEFRDHHVVELGPGECVVVPRGVEHRTCADEEAEVLLIEPAGVVNTGNVTDADFTAPTGVSI
jgi:mannose-6-phosphate isomerase-like protein (cupin superfamily)